MNENDNDINDELDAAVRSAVAEHPLGAVTYAGHFMASTGPNHGEADEVRQVFAMLLMAAHAGEPLVPLREALWHAVNRLPLATIERHRNVAMASAEMGQNPETCPISRVYAMELGAAIQRREDDNLEDLFALEPSGPSEPEPGS